MATLVACAKAARAEARCARDSRVLTAGAYGAAMLALGLAIASLGPALLPLAEQTGATLREAGYCFGARSAGYLVGSFGGPLFDRLPGHLGLAAGLALGGVGSLAIPATRSVAALGVVVSLQGLAMGFFDTGANVLLIYLFGAAVGPWMQMMHAAFAVGAFLGPMLLRAAASAHGGGDGDAPVSAPGTYDAAFYMVGTYSIAVAVALLVFKSPVSRRTTAAAAAAAATAAATATAAAGALPAAHGEAQDTELVKAGGVVDTATLSDVPLATLGDAANGTTGAGAAGGSGAPLAATDAPSSPAAVVTAASDVGGGVRLPAGAAAAADAAEAGAGGAALATRHRTVVALTALLLGIYVGCETGFGGFVTAYDVIALGMTEREGQLMAGAYWAAIMVGRIAAIPISLYLPPHRYLAASMGGCVAACLLMLFGQTSGGALWVGSILYGLCMACVFPTAIALAETFFPVHGGDATWFVVGSAVGEWVLPFIVSSLFGNVPGVDAAALPQSHGMEVGPTILLWTITVGCVANMAVLYALIRNGSALKAALATAAAAPAAAAAAATASA